MAGPVGGGGEELTLTSGAYAGDLALGSEFNPDSALFQPGTSHRVPNLGLLIATDQGLYPISVEGLTREGARRSVENVSPLLCP